MARPCPNKYFHDRLYHPSVRNDQPKQIQHYAQISKRGSSRTWIAALLLARVEPSVLLLQHPHLWSGEGFLVGSVRIPHDGMIYIRPRSFLALAGTASQSRVKTIQTRASDEKDPESSANYYPSRCASA
jgi:hypothetical protein